LWTIFEGFGAGLNATRIVEALRLRKQNTTTNTMAKILDTVRHIVFLELKRRREVMRIGGLGVVVEMDESLLNHNTSQIRRHGEPKPVDITQTECQQWCFSILERKVEGIPQKRVVYMVPDRTQATIEAIIARHVMPGSICHTDGGACYQRKEFWQSRGLIWIEHKKCTKHPIESSS
jgi:hypothetical protein